MVALRRPYILYFSTTAISVPQPNSEYHYGYAPGRDIRVVPLRSGANLPGVDFQKEPLAVRNGESSPTDRCPSNFRLFSSLPTDPKIRFPRGRPAAAAGRASPRRALRAPRKPPEDRWGSIDTESPAAIPSGAGFPESRPLMCEQSGRHYRCVMHLSGAALPVQTCAVRCCAAVSNKKLRDCTISYAIYTTPTCKRASLSMAHSHPQGECFSVSLPGASARHQLRFYRCLDDDGRAGEWLVPLTELPLLMRSTIAQGGRFYAAPEHLALLSSFGLDEAEENTCLVRSSSVPGLAGIDPSEVGTAVFSTLVSSSTLPPSTIIAARGHHSTQHHVRAALDPTGSPASYLAGISLALDVPWTQPTLAGVHQFGLKARDVTNELREFIWELMATFPSAAYPQIPALKTNTVQGIEENLRQYIGFCCRLEPELTPSDFVKATVLADPNRLASYLR